MAISEKLNHAQNPQGTPAPAAPNPVPATPATPTAPAASGKSGSKPSEVLKQQGASIRATMTADQKAVEGSKRDKVAFVASIGDPSHRQSRSEHGTSVPSVQIVGYRLKALEDMTVPVSPLKPDCQHYFDCEGLSEKPVKAGETFDVNLVEMTLLITRPEYAGRFTGEGQSVKISSSSTQDKAKVRPIFRNGENSGSIKGNIIMIADIVGKDTDPTGKGQAIIKEEFREKFGCLVRKRSAKKSGSAVNTDGIADLAAAFGAIYRKQYGGQN